MDTNGDFFPDTRIIQYYEPKRERAKNTIKYYIDGNKDRAEAGRQSLTTE